MPILWWVCFGFFTLMLLGWFSPLFFLMIGSSWDSMVLNSCVSPSNSTDLPNLGLPPERSSLSLCGRYAAYFSNLKLSNLHFYMECLGPYIKHLFFVPVATSIWWPAFFLALYSVDLLGVGGRGVISSFLLPDMTFTVGIYPSGCFRRFNPFVDLFRDFHLLKHSTSLIVGFHLKLRSLYIVLILWGSRKVAKKDLVELFRGHLLGGAQYREER